MNHIARELARDASSFRWLRDLFSRDGQLAPTGWVVRKLTFADGTTDVAAGPNIVTDAGDLWYAQSAMAETPTNTFTTCLLGTGVVTPVKANDYGDLTVISGSPKAASASYPLRNDSDTDNTGSGTDIITWKFQWAASDFNQASGISEGAITVSGASATDPLLAHFAFSPTFAKDDSTQLTLYVNHTFNGT